MEFTNLFGSSCEQVNNVTLEKLIAERGKFSNVEPTMFCVGEDFYWEYLADSDSDNEVLVSALQSAGAAYLAIYSDEVFPMIHFTSSANLELIKSDGFIKSNSDEYLALGDGIYCFDIRQGRHFRENECAIYGNVTVPHIRVLDYMDDSIKPIGEHLILSERVDICDLNIVEGAKLVKGLVECNVGTVSELLKLYGLNRDAMYYINMINGKESAQYNAVEFRDMIPNILNKLRGIS